MNYFPTMVFRLIGTDDYFVRIGPSLYMDAMEWACDGGSHYVFLPSFVEHVATFPTLADTDKWILTNV